MTRRAAELGEAAMADGGHGSPPCRYALVVLGSAGRGESLLAMDQDNAVGVADDAPAGADRWLSSSRVGSTTSCMTPASRTARAGLWRATRRGAARKRRGASVSTAGFCARTPKTCCPVDIFFDLRVAHGDAGMADRLWRHAFDVVRDKPEFAKLLVAAVGSMPAGRNLFGGFRTDQGRIDLKRAGLFGIVSVARALAVCHHVVERSTPARLSGLMALKLGLESDLDALIDAQGVLLDLILDQQVDDIKHGRPVANTVEVKRLSRRDRARLRTALQAVENLDEIVRSLLFRN